MWIKTLNECLCWIFQLLRDFFLFWTMSLLLHQRSLLPNIYNSLALLPRVWSENLTKTALQRHFQNVKWMLLVLLFVSVNNNHPWKKERNFSHSLPHTLSLIMEKKKTVNSLIVLSVWGLYSSPNKRPFSGSERYGAVPLFNRAADRVGAHTQLLHPHCCCGRYRGRRGPMPGPERAAGNLDNVGESRAGTRLHSCVRTGLFDSHLKLEEESHSVISIFSNVTTLVSGCRGCWIRFFKGAAAEQMKTRQSLQLCASD